MKTTIRARTSYDPVRTETCTLEYDEEAMKTVRCRYEVKLQLNPNSTKKVDEYLYEVLESEVVASKEDDTADAMMREARRVCFASSTQALRASAQRGEG